MITTIAKKNLWLVTLVLVWPAVIFAQTTNTPPAPSYLNVSLTDSGSQVSLNWGSVSTATHYNVYRANSPSKDYAYSVCITSGSGSTNCQDSAVTTGQTYTYRVEACTEGNGCSGAWNNQWAYSSAITLGPTNTCTGFTITTTKTSYLIGEEVNYTWACVSGVATYVQVQLVKPDYSVTTYNTYSGQGQSTMSLGFGTSNLSEGSYTLRACWAAGCPTINASTMFTLLLDSGGGGSSAPPVPGTPLGPTAVTSGTVSSYSAMLYDQMAAGTRLYMSQKVVFDWGDGTTSESTFIVPEPAGTISPAVSHTWTTAGTYYVKAKSVNTSNVSSNWSSTFVVMVASGGGGGDGTTTIPAPPAPLTATASSSGVYLSWPSVSGATHYKVWRSLESSAPVWSEVCGSLISGASCTDLNVPAGTYKYGIESCVSGLGCSGTINQRWTYSSAVTIGRGGYNFDDTPPAPEQPKGPSTVLVGQSVSVTAKLYSPTNSSLQAMIDWGDGTYFSFSTFITATSGGVYSPPVTHTYATAGSYNVRAKAKTSTGLESGWSGYLTISVTGGSGDVPAIPSNLRVEPSIATTIYLKWNDNATNEDKFNVERKLTSTADWATPLIVQLQGANITSYNDTSVTAGATYDYRVQACRSGSGCSGYTYLNGVTAGNQSLSQTAQPVTIQLSGGAIVPSGTVVFVKNGISMSAYFNNSSSVTVYLVPGTYDIQPVFAGVNSTEVKLSGALVSDGKLIMGTTATMVSVVLPMRLSVSLVVKNSAGQVIPGARVDVGMSDSSVYASAYTDSSGQAWLQLPSGTYQSLVTKAGYLSKSLSLTVTSSNTEFTAVLESLTVNVSGKILEGSTPKPFAIVRAVNTNDGSIVVVSANSLGSYVMALKAGSWHMYASADGYTEGDGGTITLSNTAQSKDITLGSAVTLTSSSANIVPTVSVTVTAVELGVKVGLPANALGSGSSATVTIKQSTQVVPTAAATPLPGSVRDISAQASGVQITTLGSAASIEFGYTEADLAAVGVDSQQVGNLKLAFWDTSRSEWEVLESLVDAANHKVIGATTHFTLFAIVLPFLAQPAGAQEPVAPVAPVSTTDDRAAQYAAIVAEGTKVYVSGPESLATSVNVARNKSLEEKYDGELVAKVIGAEVVTSGARTAMVNFVTYGTVSTIHLGAGERAGVVSSFKAAYGHVPNSEYEWQEVLKIANGRWPGTLLQERETAMKGTFKKIYLRDAAVTNPNDSAALAIMAYGLRSAKRNLSSETAAIATFRAIYGYSPSSATDWDAVRAVAYSGAKR